MSQQHDPSPWEHDQELKLAATLNLFYVNTKEKTANLGNNFSISESEAIGISCNENPSLSVLYPDKDQTTVILSHNQVYRSVTFVKVSGKEYLATSCEEDGCLYLWDTESKAPKKVFDPKPAEDHHDKGMNMFRIKDNTIGYGEAHASPEGSRRVFILKTDTPELTLSSTLRLFTPHDIWDMCYTEVEGSTPCLLLCVPLDNRIMAVEMISGKSRWEVGKEQMGEKFYPWSICTDEDNTVYVTDFKQNMIHLLYAEDGSVITSIDTRHYGIGNLVAVRFHDQHLYVEDYTHPGYKYVISKFEKKV